MGRKPSADPSTKLSIYPAQSLLERVKAQADKTKIAPATYAVDALREKVERDEAANVR